MNWKVFQFEKRSWGVKISHFSFFRSIACIHISCVWLFINHISSHISLGPPNSQWVNRRTFSPHTFFWQFFLPKCWNMSNKTCISSMIHSTRPTVPPDCRLKFVLFCEILKSGGRTYGQTTCTKIVSTTGRDCGSASWINWDNDRN